MFKKVIGLVAFAGMAGLASGVGCTVTSVTPSTDAQADTSTTPGDASPSTDRTVPPPGDSGAPGCYIAKDALFLAADTKPPAKALKLCTDAQIDGYWANCIDDKTGSEAKCTAFLGDAANKACLTCIEYDTTAKIPPVILDADAEGGFYVNEAACAFLTINKPECANTYASNLMCYASVCASCTSEAAGSACEAAAEAGACKAYTVSKVCEDALNAGETQWKPVCTVADPNDEKGGYVKVAKFLCGT